LKGVCWGGKGKGGVREALSEVWGKKSSVVKGRRVGKKGGDELGFRSAIEESPNAFPRKRKGERKRGGGKKKHD